jgi:hypothetical protein
MKGLRYQRVINDEKQVGVTSQRNKWANMDPPRYTGGGIRCLGGESILSRPFAPAMRPNSKAKFSNQNQCVQIT